MAKRHPEWDCTCPVCHAYYRGTDASGGHCMSCHETFANNTTAAAHRVGPHIRGVRRCLTVAEMLAGDWPEKKKHGGQPWRLTPRGWTKYPPVQIDTIPHWLVN